MRARAGAGALALMLLGLCQLVLPSSALAQSDAAAEAIRERVETQGEATATVSGVHVVSRMTLPRVYAAAHFQPLWTREENVRELFDAIRDSSSDGLSPLDYHLTELARLWPARAASPTPERVADFDVLASDAFMLLLYHTYFGKVDPLSLNPNWNFDRREVSRKEAADFMLEAIASGRIKNSIEALRPHHWQYDGARAALASYRKLAADGGWRPIPAGPTLRQGMTDPRVPLLRQRLAATGELSGQPLDAEAFDEALASAVRAFQQRHLLTADGAVGAGTLRELNVPVEERVNQLRVNLERGRWLLHDFPEGDFVVADIAGFSVRYVRNRKTIWRARAQVGKPYRETPIFRASIQYVVLNPTWTVPPGILEKDILPGVKRDRSYLAKKGLKVVDRNGRELDPASVEWSRYTARNFPYYLRQDAGEDNALGRVKIMFPNPHVVYLHDTPSRALFEQDDRAFSSGCIRVERPLELAELLLADPTTWNRKALDEAVAAGTTRTVNLPKDVPVLLAYWTVDQDDTGNTVFKRDIYGRDPPLLRALDGRFELGSRTLN
jgi:murein L,D-transpeptidase YcbB/YkuD